LRPLLLSPVPPPKPPRRGRPAPTPRGRLASYLGLARELALVPLFLPVLAALLAALVVRALVPDERFRLLSFVVLVALALAWGVCAALYGG
jgi:hypothetical protein